MSTMHKKELLQIFLKCYKSHYNKMVQLQIYKPSMFNINDIENWELSQLASFIKQENLSNVNEAYKMSLIIIASVDLDQNLSQAKAKHRYFAGIIKRSISDKSSKFRSLRIVDISNNNFKRTIFKSAVATLACILGIVTVASGIGTLAGLGIFMLISIAKNLANLACDSFDSYNTREYLQILDMVSLDNPDYANNYIVEISDESAITNAIDNEVFYLSSLLQSSTSLFKNLSESGIIDPNASEILEVLQHDCLSLQQKLDTPQQSSLVTEIQAEVDRRIFFDNGQAGSIANTRTANHINIEVANTDEAEKIKNFTTNDIIRVTEIAKDINNNPIDQLEKHFSLILNQDFSEFAIDDRVLLDSINQKITSLYNTELEQFVMSEAVNLLNQSLDKYSLNQAFYRIIAIIFLSEMQLPTKVNIFKLLLEEIESGKNSYNNILNRHNRLISERKYLVYDVAIGIASSFVDIFGLHMFDFSSVAQTALSGIAEGIYQIIDSKVEQQKHKNMPKTKSAKNLQNLLNALVNLQSVSDSEVNAIMA